MNTIDRKNNAKNYINENISNIEKQIKILNEQKEYYEKKLENLENYDSFTKQEIKELIEYLVTSMEEEKYVIKKIHMNTKSSSYHVKNLISEYTFLYLVKEDNQQEAIREIKEKYNVSTINDENYIKDTNIMNKPDISNNYVKLSFYNKYSRNQVKFSSKKDENIIPINIIDDRFKYINDFIENVMNKKLDERDFKLSISEMKLLVDSFITKNKKEKTKTYINN